ncbi:YchJ family protein [Nonlabens antarcticus]|uniref:YchJ family protein n=1 Tax=Nonlabens antarcticus TaxID=392714 RepID=UPI001E452C53|nr:YchJ family metal-binding protein [Nonlabens antarcticus]
MEDLKMTCPCHSAYLYKNCCSIAHKNIKAVRTAEQLMRSRYSAFVLGNTNYLSRSHHSSQKPTNEEMREIELWTKSVTWIKLEITQTSMGLENDVLGTVEFTAHFKEAGKLQTIQEHSRFCKENGHWVYFDAIEN